MTSAFVETLLSAPTPVITEVKLTDGIGTDLLGARTVREVVDTYHDAGARCISVVTGRWFGGNIQLLREVAALTDAPLLQKDFLTRESELRQARELGASAVLLTAKLLPTAVLGHLIEHALRIGLTPFVEVRDEKEIDAVTHGPDCVVAVNNKNIHHKERDHGDIQRSLQLLAAVTATGTPCPVSASGIHHPETAAHLINFGYAGLLIGTTLLRSSSPQAWLTEFDRHRNTSSGPETP